MADGRWNLGIFSVKVGLRYTDNRNPCSMRVTNTSKKGNLLSYYFSIVSCIDFQIEFTWSSNVWTSSWCGQRMNVSYMYLSHIEAVVMLILMPFLWSIPSKCWPIQLWTHSLSFFLFVYIRIHHDEGRLYTGSRYFHQIIYRDAGAFFLQRFYRHYRKKVFF